MPSRDEIQSIANQIEGAKEYMGSAVRQIIQDKDARFDPAIEDLCVALDGLFGVVEGIAATLRT